MKLAKAVIIVGIIFLIGLAETTRMNILRHLEMGSPVSEYELHSSQLLQILSFTPVGLGIGIASLFFPQHVTHWLDRLSGTAKVAYSPLELLGLRLVGLVFIGATLRALWTTSQFLFR